MHAAATPFNDVVGPRPSLSASSLLSLFVLMSDGLSQAFDRLLFTSMSVDKLS